MTPDWEEWEFARTSTDEEDRQLRHARMLRALARMGAPAKVAAPVPPPVVAPPKPVAVLPPPPPAETKAQRKAKESALRGAAMREKMIADGLVTPINAPKKSYTPADAKADRQRWLENAKKVAAKPVVVRRAK